MTTCIPIAQGVPGHYNEPPYFLPGGLYPQNTALDDQRWVGAANQGLTCVSGGASCVGANEEVRFRALYQNDPGGTALYLSWQVRFDPSLDAGSLGDRFYVGFQPSGGGTAMVIKIVPYNSAASSFDDQPAETIGPTPGVGSITTYTNTAPGVWTALGSDPTWINNNTRIWLNLAPTNWAVEMRVPVGGASITDNNGPNLGATFNMWYCALVKTPGGVLYYKWPTGTANITFSVSGEVYPDPAGSVTPPSAPWDQFHESTGPGDPVCVAEPGISITYLDIGTTNPVASEIKFHDPPPGPTNTLFARPLNNMASAIPATTLHARFRIANWGSVADPNAPWLDVPGGADVTNSNPIPTGPQPGTTPISFNWSLNASDIATFITGAYYDKCMLVDLWGVGLTFINDSVYRNMDFVSASTFQRKAKINIKGIGSIPGTTHRDVYIAVETINMPASTGGGRRGDGGKPNVSAGNIAEGRLDPARQKELVGMARTGRLSQDQIEQFMPTIRYHVYHDTGERITEGGRTYQVLEPQSSFGYYVVHEGPLTGWANILQGATRIAPNFYKLRVPHDGEAEITHRIVAKTTVIALEQGGLPGCLQILAALLSPIINLIKKLLGQP